MRKTVLANTDGTGFYILSQFPSIGTQAIQSKLTEPCLEALNNIFDSYIEKIEPQLNQKTKSKALAAIERIRKSTVKKFHKTVEGYASTISGISPRGFSNV